MNPRFVVRIAAVCAAALAMFGSYAPVGAQTAEPAMLDSNLTVRSVVSGLDQPTTMAFIDDGEFLVLERATGRVQYVKSRILQKTVLDLAVNSAPGRGLLGIALHPEFPAAGKEYVYLFWTESSTGADTDDMASVPVLGNRVDRYLWNGDSLVFDRTILRLRAFQGEESELVRGNHGGVMAFGPDGKLYVFVGDVGRRGQMQNNDVGPDDTFGGPEPDDEHLTGAILRLSDNGSTPNDNPFFDYGASIGGEAGANIQKIFAYGMRNSFGMAFDPESGELWVTENGDDTFDELNRVRAGMNGGWLQISGPVDRIAQFKGTSDSIAGTPEQALARLFMLPGAQYRDPVFAWRHAIAPSAIGFMSGGGIGPSFAGDLFVGSSATALEGGYLFRIKLADDRLKLELDDAGIQDGVADNTTAFDITESERFLIGRNFGVVTDIETGRNGNLFVVSLSNGAIYEIERTKGTGDTDQQVIP